MSFQKMPLAARAGNTVVSYADYIGQMFYPANLVVFYPHPGKALPFWKIALALILLIAISNAAFNWRKQRPWLLSGWLWYLGMLVPVIGLVQAGDLARADRYTYLPQIGLYLLLTWGAADLCARLPHRRLLLGSLATTAIAALALTAHRQTSHWRDSETLWNHALACDPDHLLAHENLGAALDSKGRIPEAISHYQRAVEIKPDYDMAQNNLGLDLFLTGRLSEAVPHFQKALEVKPAYAAAHNNLANVFLQTGQFEDAASHYRKALESSPDSATTEANLGIALVQTGHLANAIVHYERALALQPDYAKPQANLGSALLQTGRASEAIPHLERAIALQPNYAIAHANLGSALLATGAPREAIAHFQQALDLQPPFYGARTILAWTLATHPDASLRDGPRAVTIARQASEAAGGTNAYVLRTLAAAYAEAGRFPEAVQTAQLALQLPETQARLALREALQAQLALYQSGRPFHETVLSETERTQIQLREFGSQVHEEAMLPESGNQLVPAKPGQVRPH